MTFLLRTILAFTPILSLVGSTVAQSTQPINLNVPAGTQVVITVSAPASQPTFPATQPVTQPAPVKMAIGTNVTANDPWQTYAPWCDVTHLATGWTAGGNDPAIVYGPGGYPQTPAFSHLWLYAYPPGPYHLHFAAATSDVLSIAGKSIANLKAVSPGVFEGDVTFASGDFVNFRATGPVSDVHLYAPDAVAGQTFRKAFTDALRPYKAVRLMPWARPNAEMDKGGVHTWPLQWAQRNLPGNWDQTSREVALEYQFQLAKESGCIPWINLYWGEDDDAITHTAQMAASYGFPTIIVEPMGNEPWNMGGGYQGNEIRKAGQAAGLAGDLNVAGARYTAQQGAHAAQVLRAVLGNKVKVVFSAQATWGAWAKDGLTFVPAGSFDAASVAPYFNNATALPATATVADWEASSATWINTILDNGLGENQAAAQAAGAELWCYEAGQSYFPLMANPPNVPIQDTAANLAAFNADFITKFQTDPAMGRLYDLLFATCRKHNVTLCTHFYLCGYWGRSGYWGAKQFLTDPDNAKTQALGRAIAAGN